MNTLEKRLITLQQQLEQLNVEVASLLASTSAIEPNGTQKHRSSTSQSQNTSTSQVGLNRFRQLAKEAA